MIRGDNLIFFPADFGWGGLPPPTYHLGVTLGSPNLTGLFALNDPISTKSKLNKSRLALASEQTINTYTPAHGRYEFGGKAVCPAVLKRCWRPSGCSLLLFVTLGCAPPATWLLFTTLGGAPPSTWMLFSTLRRGARSQV